MHRLPNARRVLFAVLFGFVICQLLLHFSWCLAQRQELRIRKGRRRVNNARKACYGRSCYTTHSPRKLTWTPSTVFHRNFWIFTLVLFVVGLMFVPRMPDLGNVPAHLPTTTPSSQSGLNLPPRPKFNPPQWFDPPHRDQIFWLKNIATVVRHSAEVSWQVLTVSLPVTDNPDLLPTESLLTDSLAAAAQLAPSNEATRLSLNTTICINPDTEAWSVKGGRHPSMAPALEVSDNDAWHFASAETEQQAA